MKQSKAKQKKSMEKHDAQKKNCPTNVKLERVGV
jgi:hypothetical protein